MTCSGTVERVTRERRADSCGANVIGAKCNRLPLLGKGFTRRWPGPFEGVTRQDYEALRVAAHKARGAAENGR